RDCQTRYILQDKSSMVGLPAAVITKSTLDGQVLYQTSNYYKQSDQLSNKQGLYEEITHEHKLINNQAFSGRSDDWIHQTSVTRISFLPAVLTKTVRVDKKQQTRLLDQKLDFDLYSGQPTHSYTEDGYGNGFVTKTTPAYRHYKEMDAKNMLTQGGASYTYLMQDDFDPNAFQSGDELLQEGTKVQGLLGASFQAWSKNIPVVDRSSEAFLQSNESIYRLSATYEFIGNETNSLSRDGSLGLGNFTEMPFYNRDAINTPLAELGLNLKLGLPEWQKNSEMTLYDVNSHLLETRDINGVYASSRYDNSNDDLYATAANARYSEFAFTGLEDEPIWQDGPDPLGGGASRSGGIIGSVDDGYLVHTGDRSVRTTTFQYPLLFEIENAESEKYRASVWCTHPQAIMECIVDGQLVRTVSASEAKKAGSWYLIEMTVDVNWGESIKFRTKSLNGRTMYWDDFRVHPVDAVMNSFVYNKYGELSDVLDANNLFTHYEYDAAGRLKSITRETMDYGPVKVSERVIHYSETN
ncbi:MAG: RHS repeat domain-containing protein, partial [Bacteroidota bacterium]